MRACPSISFQVWASARAAAQFTAIHKRHLVAYGVVLVRIYLFCQRTKKSILFKNEANTSELELVIHIIISIIAQNSKRKNTCTQPFLFPQYSKN